MKAKDTVMGNKKIQLLGQQYEDDLPTYDLNHYLLLAQAEISYKAGAGEKEKAKERGLEAGEVIGIRKVVEWANGYCEHRQGRTGIQNMPRRYCEDCWQAKLKEWGIK